MLTPLLTLALLRAPILGQDPPPTASGLLSAMLKRYADAKSLSATIRTTQTAPGASVVTDTALAVERPAKIRLAQTQRGGSINRRSLLVCDGDGVIYTTPPEMVHRQEPYQYEPLVNVSGNTRNSEQLYDLVGSALPDRSPVLDVIAGGFDDRTYFANQLASFALKGQETVAGKAGWAIEGDWREAPDRRASGKFKMVVTAEGELLRYVLVQHFSIPATGSRQGRPAVGAEPVAVTTTWDASVTLNPTFKKGTFDLKE